MSRCTIYTDQHVPSGQTIRYNVDETSRAVAERWRCALDAGCMMKIENEDGGEPIFVNPERVATISPAKED